MFWVLFGILVGVLRRVPLQARVFGQELLEGGLAAFREDKTQAFCAHRL